VRVRLVAVRLHETTIPGVRRIDLDVQPNDDGWFKENYHHTKLGLDFQPVQHNVAHFERPGILRGIHAEPWDKYLSPSAGKVFVALVDLRTDARVETFVLTPAHALYVPRGVGNSFCTLEAHTTYNFLVNEHWSPDRVTVNPFDPDLAIDWPLDELKVTDRDRANPALAELRKSRA
jgi:dTDP-4-dehydrorhamnose 3,5-epimerase